MATFTGSDKRKQRRLSMLKTVHRALLRPAFAADAPNRQYRRVHAMSSSFQDQKFGPYTIQADEQFAQTSLSYAFVNLKPIVKGHVLISPKRPEARFGGLSQAEIADIWQLAQRVGKALERNLDATSLTLAIQDGPAAGQSVPHVHIHCLPRREGDFRKNDDVYDALDSAEHKQSMRGEKLDMDAERTARTSEEMKEEAAVFREYFVHA